MFVSTSLAKIDPVTGAKVSVAGVSTIVAGTVIELITGASFTAATLTVAVIDVADSAPLLSFATAVKAFSVPLALAAGVQ